MAGAALSRPPLQGRLLDFQTIPDERGTLVVVEEKRHIPFRIGSVQWASPHSAPAAVDIERGEPAETMIAALSGSFDVAVGSARSALLFGSAGLMLGCTCRRALFDREPVGRSRMARSHKPGWRPPFVRAEAPMVPRDLAAARGARRMDGG